MIKEISASNLENSFRKSVRIEVTDGKALAAVLEQAGISEEEFAAMSAEQQQALLDELGAAMQQKEQQQQEQQAKPKTTIDDVAAGGSYVVTVGDSLMWNYFELCYEDGKLVKIVVSFQKNDEEEADVQVVEGDAIAEFTLFFIDYTVSAPELVDALKNQGYTNVYINKAQ